MIFYFPGHIDLAQNDERIGNTANIAAARMRFVFLDHAIFTFPYGKRYLQSERPHQLRFGIAISEVIWITYKLLFTQLLFTYSPIFMYNNGGYLH
jgi:hypothetical protein